MGQAHRFDRDDALAVERWVFLKLAVHRGLARARAPLAPTEAGQLAEVVPELHGFSGSGLELGDGHGTST
jgi:hypothetical protein